MTDGVMTQVENHCSGGSKEAEYVIRKKIWSPRLIGLLVLEEPASVG